MKVYLFTIIRIPVYLFFMFPLAYSTLAQTSQETLEVTGISDYVEIITDPWGISHI